ncbi:MAG: sulfite exporter TauE/SafE family protein [Microscillaceae bacterium]|nr:sulfite exporter TauE/SafE family protein [Microscillaceae bacterium]
MIFYTALLIGFLGGLHCVAMCGPLVLILSRSSGGIQSWNVLLNALIYNAGRILTYSFLGLIVGLSGRGLVLVSSQQWLSLGIGLLILGSFFLSAKLRNYLNVLRYSHHLSLQFRRKFRLYGKKHGGSTQLIQGVFHGFLPCGTVYLALAGALATGEIWAGALYMFIFGLGTLPFLLAVRAFGHVFLGKLRVDLHKSLISVFAFSLAGLLIIRALNLGIPYLSPKLIRSESRVECCEVEIK